MTALPLLDYQVLIFDVHVLWIDYTATRDITAIFFVLSEMRQMCATGKGGNNKIPRESQIELKLNADFNEFLSDHGAVCVLLQVSQWIS